MTSSSALRFGQVCFLIGNLFVGSVLLSEPPSGLDAFLKALRGFNGLVEKLSSGAALGPDELSVAGHSALQLFGQLPEDQRAMYRDALNLLWYTQAVSFAKAGRYKEALCALDQEMAYQYGRNAQALLGGQGRDLFRDLIALEANIVGHLGRGFYPNEIDHYFVPTDINGDGVDEFVAMERTREPDEFSLPIPPLPPNSERWVLYLLTRQPSNKYEIRSSAQLIGRRGGKGPVELTRSDDGTGIVVTDVLCTVETRYVSEIGRNVPVKYVPRTNATVTFKATLDGFELVGSTGQGTQ